MDRSPTALVLIDVISPFDFDGADRLLQYARPAAPVIADLAARARAAGAAVIYANDNFAGWTQTFDQLVERCTRPDAPGRDVVRTLRPEPDDYFVLKPKHSAFFQSPLESLLTQLEARTLVLAGFATDICVLATALDAAMREFRLVVPQDATAAETAHARDAALVHFRRVLHAETPPAAAVQFAPPEQESGDEEGD